MKKTVIGKYFCAAMLIVLCLVSALSLSACENNKPASEGGSKANGESMSDGETPAEAKEFKTFKEASEAMENAEKAAKSYKTKTTSDMKMTISGMEMPIKMVDESTFEKIGSDTEFSKYSETTQDAAGEKTTTKTYSDTKKEYLQGADGKWEEIGNVVSAESGDFDSFFKESSGELKKENDGYTMTIDLTGAEYEDYLKNVFGFDETVALNAIEVFKMTAKIDNNGRPISVSVQVKMTVAMEGMDMSCEMNMGIVYSDFDTAKITVPDIKG